jgi:hypothetical protein
MDAETRIRKLLTFLQSRMEARGVAVGRLQVPFPPSPLCKKTHANFYVLFVTDHARQTLKTLKPRATIRSLAVLINIHRFICEIIHLIFFLLSSFLLGGLHCFFL